MINVEFKPLKHEISIKGHANFAEEGKDIICASASALLYTVKASLEKASEMVQEGTLKITVKKGNAKVKCVPKEAYEGNVDVIFWTVLNGFEALAEAYPDHVTLTIK